MGRVKSLRLPRRQLCLEVLEDRTAPATFTVTSLGDSGPGTLRDCLTQANSTPGADTILFTVTGIINLNSVLPAIVDDVTITGPGSSVLQINHASSTPFRIFTIAPMTNVTISGLTVSNGQDAGGGGIATSGNLNLDDVTFLGNSTIQNGGGGGLSINTSVVVNVSNCAFLNNSAPNAPGSGTFGGGIATIFATLSVRNTLFSGNSATDGAGLASLGSEVPTTVTNCTFTANGPGDAILNAPNSRLVLDHCTLYQNAGPAFNNAFSLTLQNSILAANSGGNFIPGTGVTSLGHNISDRNDGAFLNQPGDLINTNPQLAGSGGLFTPLPGSPALDSADPSDGVTDDERGVSRPQGAGPDIGAVEALYAVTSAGGNGQAVPVTASFAPLQVLVTEDGQPIAGILVTFTILSGDASFGGATSVTVSSGATGLAVAPTLSAGAAGGTILVKADIGPSATFFSESVTPLVSAGPDQFIDAGALFQRLGSFVDAGQNQFTATVNYGDGTAAQPLALNPDGTFLLAHVYAAEGSFVVTVTVSDGQGRTGSASFFADVLPPGVPPGLAEKTYVALGATADVQAPGIFAEVTHRAGDSFGALIVGDVPVSVAASLVPADQPVLASYEVREIDLSDADTATVTFDYFTFVSVPPTLSFIDRFGVEHAVPLDPRSVRIDLQAETITATFDRTTFPRLTDLTNTIFTISVPRELDTSSANAPLALALTFTLTTLNSEGPGIAAAALSDAGGKGGPSGVVAAAATGVTGLGTTGGGDELAPTDAAAALSHLPEVAPSLITLPALSVSPAQPPELPAFQPAAPTVPPRPAPPAAPAAPAAPPPSDTEARAIEEDSRAGEEVVWHLPVGVWGFDDVPEAGEAAGLDWSPVALAVALLLPEWQRRIRQLGEAQA
jgi:hypothetical protein